MELLDLITHIVCVTFYADKRPPGLGTSPAHSNELLYRETGTDLFAGKVYDSHRGYIVLALLTLDLERENRVESKRRINLFRPPSGLENPGRGRDATKGTLRGAWRLSPPNLVRAWESLPYLTFKLYAYGSAILSTQMKEGSSSKDHMSQLDRCFKR